MLIYREGTSIAAYYKINYSTSIPLLSAPAVQMHCLHSLGSTTVRMGLDSAGPTCHGLTTSLEGERQSTRSLWKWLIMNLTISILFPWSTENIFYPQYCIIPTTLTIHFKVEKVFFFLFPLLAMEKQRILLNLSFLGSCYFLTNAASNAYKV